MKRAFIWCTSRRHHIMYARLTAINVRRGRVSRARFSLDLLYSWLGSQKSKHSISSVSETESAASGRSSATSREGGEQRRRRRGGGKHRKKDRRDQEQAWQEGWVRERCLGVRSERQVQPLDARRQVKGGLLLQGQAQREGRVRERPTQTTAARTARGTSSARCVVGRRKGSMEKSKMICGKEQCRQIANSSWN